MGIIHKASERPTRDWRHFYDETVAVGQVFPPTVNVHAAWMHADVYRMIRHYIYGKQTQPTAHWRHLDFIDLQGGMLFTESAPPSGAWFYDHHKEVMEEAMKLDTGKLPSNHYAPWTESARQQLIDMYLYGFKTIKKIADFFGRSEWAIICQLEKMNYVSSDKTTQTIKRIRNHKIPEIRVGDGTQEKPFDLNTFLYTAIPSIAVDVWAHIPLPSKANGYLQEIARRRDMYVLGIRPTVDSVAKPAPVIIAKETGGVNIWYTGELKNKVNREKRILLCP